MTRTTSTVLSLCLVVSVAGATGSQPAPAAASTAEIDRDVWVPVAASVANDDIVAMGKVYHPAAVLVTKEGTKPIAAALDGWGKDIVAAKKVGTRASVAFRFASRRDDATTAFETGIFKYSTTDKAGKVTSGYTQMEALLTKHNGAWRIVMEHQLDETTEAAWNAPIEAPAAQMPMSSELQSLRIAGTTSCLMYWWYWCCMYIRCSGLVSRSNQARPPTLSHE